MTPLIIALSILAALLIGCAVMLILFAAFRPMQPDILKPGQVHGPYGGQPWTPDPPPPRRKVPPEVAQMPVVEAGACFLRIYQFDGAGRMKVSELSGATLDLWVAKALGDRLARIVGAEEHERCETRFGEIWAWNRFMPSRAWMDGGPIIEREGFGICKFYEPTDGPIPEGHEWCALWRDDSMRADGPTPLVAGMRLYVMSKFGEEVTEE